MPESNQANKKAEGRVLLPSTIIPSRYDIKLTPDLEAFTFGGFETVTVTTSDDISTNEITMHAKELTFTAASYIVASDASSSSGPTTTSTKPVEAESITVNLKATTVTFTFPSPLPPSSTLIVSITFAGLLNNQMAGFYRSKYTDIHGVEKIMGSTQFEALDARRAFPCWDEPARKAVFGVTLVVPTTLTVFSNMPETSRRSLVSEDGKNIALQEVTFADSPKMSSYLVAFCVGEFDFVQGVTAHGVTVRVYTPPGKSATGTFSLDCALRSLDLYDDFFGAPYPLPKLDMVAIPEFAMGAMENWGLVTYREVDLLIDEVKASSAQRQRVCSVVAHELAHQWFGNLVTMAWWDDLWLNEGFATWTADFATSVLFPEWRIWDQYTTGNLAAALRLDALRSSHPIQVPIAHAEEVEQVFDAISYCKGGSVVRMIHAVLGKKAFQEGLANYMKKHQYSNTETFDLWKAWEESSGLPVAEMMASWTEQMGFPVIKVVGEKWSDDSVTLELKQQWFLADGSELSPSDAAKTWCVPLLTCTAAGPQSDVTFMREATATVTVPLPSADGWVKLNAGQEVPIRVQMSEEMTKRLAEGIQSKALPPSDRAGVLNDAYALVKAGQLSPSSLITLLSYYPREDDAIVWEAIEGVLGSLNTILSDDEAMNAYFNEFARKLVSGLTKVVSWDPDPTNDGHLTSLLRGTMIRLLSEFCYDEEEVKTEASTRFAKFLEDASDVKNLPSDARTSVFKIVLKNGGNKEYEDVLGYFDTATDNAERKFVMGSLGAAKDSKLKLRTMEWATSGKVKLQDMFYPMGSVGHSSREGREISWKYFKDNFDKIKGMIEKGSPSLMTACIVYCCGSFCSEEKANDIEAFFNEHPLPLCQRKIEQTVENMRANAGFLKRLKESDLSSEGFWSSTLS